MYVYPFFYKNRLEVATEVQHLAQEKIIRRERAGEVSEPPLSSPSVHSARCEGKQHCMSHQVHLLLNSWKVEGAWTPGKYEVSGLLRDFGIMQP